MTNLDEGDEKKSAIVSIDELFLNVAILKVY
jgi:hypothetical protein